MTCAEMIDCVSIATSHNFTGNLVREQHRLRHAEVIQRLGWRGVYEINDLDLIGMTRLRQSTSCHATRTEEYWVRPFQSNYHSVYAQGVFPVPG